ncbi:putative pyridoxal kinase BUD16 NDAI_0G00390 [Naumovozyma dairenensis CBS 421]|uniref:pyridoxal kinase n=1 Tax=Naumovozyma dairenensis (strain ATCC 10597 / BCRC 20456 / CBS 421 / NBRC 0211 / NRRL Y-12639) TaxID=1071378 RepID=G0WDF4_NAUDC|nr:hypothetical protein NDAI_0G00390 [Naumovozyma dairenensis CBS 421]CCD25815.2 hypothetical protein NDAI_0G00390 [Naumovozyma dairenensis CBS 421]
MPRLLATQSHVVHGYVGNKAATFPLQCLGWDVDCCNSVQFSNHTGYGMDKVFGNITEHNHLDQLLSGIFKNFPNEYNALLSGYLPNKDSVKCMGINYKKFKKQNPNSIWLMDPVMGDEDELYVNEDVIPEYRNLILSDSSDVDIITPNQFELEILYGKKIIDQNELKLALNHLHKRIPVIIVTSCDPRIFHDEDYVYCVASMRGHAHPLVYRVPLIDSYFTGVGDLFAAILLDRIYSLLNKEDEEISAVSDELVFEKQINDVLNVLQRVLHLTKKLAPKNVKSKIGSALDMKEMELRIIEARDLYGTDINPNEDFLYSRL